MFNWVTMLYKKMYWGNKKNKNIKKKNNIDQSRIFFKENLEVKSRSVGHVK